jgi:hypothetical protein
MLVTLLCLVFTWKEYVASKDKFGVIETLKKYPSLCFVFILHASVNPQPPFPNKRSWSPFALFPAAFFLARKLLSSVFHLVLAGRLDRCILLIHV